MTVQASLCNLTMVPLGTVSGVVHLEHMAVPFLILRTFILIPIVATKVHFQALG